MTLLPTRTSTRLFWALLATILTAASCLASSSDNEDYYRVDYDRPWSVPSVRLEDLQRASSTASTVLQEALTTTGLLAIQLPTTTTTTTTTLQDFALQSWCDCTSKWSSLDTIPGTDRVILSGDGTTQRTSLATATLGMHNLLALPQELEEACGMDTLTQLEGLREQVATASRAFVQALDATMVQRPPDNSTPLLRNQHGGAYTTVQSIVQASQQLEHFHLYQQPPQPQQETTSTTTQKPALSLHTDVGLFLAFRPAHICRNQGDHELQDRSFVVPDPHDNTILRPAVFPPNSIGILMGMAAEQWIQWPKQPQQQHTTSTVKATRHAVYMNPQSSQGLGRAWYGMMHLLPESAILHNNNDKKHRTTFGELRQDMILRKDNLYTRTYGDASSTNHAIAMGCGHQHPHQQIADFTTTTTSQQPLRRLQHVENANACNNRTNFYCWMSCLEIPEQPTSNNNEQPPPPPQELYCLDPSILAGSNGDVSLAQAPCYERGVLGLAMNTNCMGWWAPAAASNAVAQPLSVPTDNNNNNNTSIYDEEPFCYGGTSMYMDGFNWLGTTCPIYLFPDLVLETPASLVLACLATMALCLVLEGIILARRTIPCLGPHSTMHPSLRLGVSACLYGMQLTMGYLIMLVVMIYSIPLFLSVVLGLMLGHVLVSSPDSVYRRYQHHNKCHQDENAEADEDEEEAAARTLSEHSSSEPPTSCCSMHNTNSKAVVSAVQREVPEGSTPCCQNEVRN